jgi:hypothetical protein
VFNDPALALQPPELSVVRHVVDCTFGGSIKLTNRFPVQFWLEVSDKILTDPVAPAVSCSPICAQTHLPVWAMSKHTLSDLSSREGGSVSGVQNVAVPVKASIVDFPILF